MQYMMYCTFQVYQVLVYPSWHIRGKYYIQTSSVFQFGTLFDVTGGGYYVNPTEWTSGRTGFTGPGEQILLEYMT